MDGGGGGGGCQAAVPTPKIKNFKNNTYFVGRCELKQLSHGTCSYIHIYI